MYRGCIERSTVRDEKILYNIIYIIIKDAYKSSVPLYITECPLLIPNHR